MTLSIEDAKILRAARLDLQRIATALDLIERPWLGRPWLGWTGGESPVPKMSYVDIKYRDGRTHYDIGVDQYLDWTVTGESDKDIIAWRLVRGAPE